MDEIFSVEDSYNKVALPIMVSGNGERVIGEN